MNGARLTVLALLGVLALVLVAAPQADPRVVGYSHGKATLTVPRGQWALLGSAPVRAGRTGSVHVQLPVDCAGCRWARLRLVRQPGADGTGDLDVTMRPGVRRWHITHSHAMRGWDGRVQVLMKVGGRGVWRSPYRIVKVVSHER